MEKLKVAVIGAGYWGPNLIRNFSTCPLTELVAICDANPARLEAVGRGYPQAKQVGSLKELLELPNRPDAVAIATPVTMHFPLATACMEAGLHVMVEKPMTAGSAEGVALLDLAEKTGRVLMVDHTYLFSNPVKLIKKIFDSGDLGELYYIDSVRINLGLFQRDINVIWDLAPHDFSLVDHLLCSEPRSISAWGCAHANEEIEDIAYVNVDYGERMMASFHVNWLSPMKVRQIIFAGSKKSLIFTELNASEPIRVYDRGIDLAESTDEQRHRLLVSYRSGDGWIPHVEPAEPLQAAVRHFAECIRDGTRPVSDGAMGLRVVRALEAATRSMRAGGGRIVLSSRSYGYGNGETPAVRPGQLSENQRGRGPGKARDDARVREPVRM